jgi:hypothetical protein
MAAAAGQVRSLLQLLRAPLARCRTPVRLYPHRFRAGLVALTDSARNLFTGHATAADISALTALSYRLGAEGFASACVAHEILTIEAGAYFEGQVQPLKQAISGRATTKSA